MEEIRFSVYRLSELASPAKERAVEAIRSGADGEAFRALNDRLHEAAVPRIAEGARAVGFEVEMTYRRGVQVPDIFWGFKGRNDARFVSLRGSWSGVRAVSSATVADAKLHEVADLLAQVASKHPDAYWRTAYSSAIDSNSPGAKRAIKKLIEWAGEVFSAEWDRLTGTQALEAFLDERGGRFIEDGSLYRPEQFHDGAVAGPLGLRPNVGLLEGIFAEVAVAIRHARAEMGGTHDHAVNAVARHISGVFVRRGLALDEGFLEATGAGLREKIEAAWRRQAGLAPPRTRDEIVAALRDPSPRVRERVVAEEQLTHVQVLLALSDPDAGVRRAAVLRHGRDFTVEQVAMALTDRDARVRALGAEANAVSYRLDENSAGEIARRLRARMCGVAEGGQMQSREDEVAGLSGPECEDDEEEQARSNGL